MNRTITYLISDKDAGFTIEQNLRHRGYSAKNITHLKKTPESVLLNGIWVHMTHRLTSGDELVIRIVEEQSSERVPPVEQAGRDADPPLFEQLLQFSGKCTRLVF